MTVLRSRHFFGRLRLQAAKVPEPTPAPAPIYLGRLWLQAKKTAPAPYTKIIFHFELFKSELVIQVYFGPYLPFKVMFDTRTRLFFFACLKDAAGAALKKAAPAPTPGSDPKKNRLRLRPKSAGSRRFRLRLRNTAPRMMQQLTDPSG